MQQHLPGMRRRRSIRIFISRQHNGQDVCDIYHVVSGSGIILPTSSETLYSLFCPDNELVVLIDRTRVGKSFDAISEILEFFHRENKFQIPIDILLSIHVLCVASEDIIIRRTYLCWHWPALPAYMLIHTFSKTENYLRKLWDKSWFEKKHSIHSLHVENLWSIVIEHALRFNQRGRLCSVSSSQTCS